LADEQVAVVKGRGQDRYLDFSLRRSALLYIGEFKAAEGTLVGIWVGGGGGWFLTGGKQRQAFLPPW
jgi:hypothetical protein